ncbi:IS6 family transposase (plasmid) [Morganella morganii]|uniref:IS6 family transposase n=1 Tax=Morganella morganii TaxID=582 RepID=UPI0038704499
MSLIRKAFQRLHYPVDIIAQCVRWYLAYSLSLRDLEEMMAERGIQVDHATLHRWVLRLVPLIAQAACRYKRPVSQKWHIDETYIKIKGQWRYLYRAIDSAGNTVDFLLTRHRDVKAARRFFKQAISHHPCPLTVTIDKSSANRKALDSFNAGFSRYKPITIRQNKYLNNRIEQDHRAVKRRTRGMLGFKSFRCAQILLAGIELMHMFRKGQFKIDDKVPLSPSAQYSALVA